jgi:hypothetical protein
MSNILALCDTVRQTSLAIHQYFRSGHLEKVYENTLAHRLRNKAIDVKHARGLLYKEPRFTELNLTSLTMVSSSCGK